MQKLKNSLGSGTLVPPKSPKFRGLSGEAEASLPSFCTASGRWEREEKNDILPFIKDPKELELWSKEFFVEIVKSIGYEN